MTYVYIYFDIETDQMHTLVTSDIMTVAENVHEHWDDKPMKFAPFMLLKNNQVYMIMEDFIAMQMMREQLKQQISEFQLMQRYHLNSGWYNE